MASLPSNKLKSKNIEDISNNNLNNIVDNNQKKNKNSKGGFYIFKAKSIEKNIIKYPYENSNDFLVPEENKPYTDPLTIRQESIYKLQK